MPEDQPHRSDAMAPPPAFRMEREPSPEGVILLVLAGEIDLATSGQFRADVDEAIEEGATQVADVEEVTFMDSTMLRELLRAHRDLGGAGRRFILAAPQPPVRRLLELTGTAGLFTLSATRVDAIASA